MVISRKTVVTLLDEELSDRRSSAIALCAVCMFFTSARISGLPWMIPFIGVTRADNVASTKRLLSALAISNVLMSTISALVILNV